MLIFGYTEDALSLQVALIDRLHRSKALINTSQKVLPPLIERPLILQPVPILFNAAYLLAVVVRNWVGAGTARRVDPMLLYPPIKVLLLLLHTPLISNPSHSPPRPLKSNPKTPTPQPPHDKKKKKKKKNQNKNSPPQSAPPPSYAPSQTRRCPKTARATSPRPRCPR